MNWIVENLNGTLAEWGKRLNEILDLISASPQELKDGTVWEAIKGICDGLKAIGIALVVFFFILGIARSSIDFSIIKKPSEILKFFLRFILAKALVTRAADIMAYLSDLAVGIIRKISSSTDIIMLTDMKLPSSLVNDIENAGVLEAVPLWLITLLGSIFITVMSFIMLLTVYGRFFKIYMYTAVAPLPLSSIAGESTSRIGKSFLKSYLAVLLEGLIALICCVIFSLMVKYGPSLSNYTSVVNNVWSYICELAFDMLLLVSMVKMSDRVVKEMIGV